jgi:transposase-like protein
VPVKSKEKKGKKRYTAAEKAQIAVATTINDYKISKTSRETGVPEKSIKRIMEYVGPIATRRDTRELVEAGDAAKEKALEKHTDYIDKVYSAKLAIINRMEILIPRERDLNKLTNALKVLGELSGEIKKEDPVMNFYQQINNNLISNGKAKNSPKGD